MIWKRIGLHSGVALYPFQKGSVQFLKAYSYRAPYAHVHEGVS